jgi:hypothetical protein
VLAFAVAQFAYSLVMVFGYAGFFVNKVRSGQINGKTTLPRKLVAVNEDGT